MNYSKLSKLLKPNVEEIHYINDNTIEKEYKDNNYNYIIFSYTTDYFPDVITTLKNNNIKYIIKKDSFNLEYILIK
tara:strand:- start:181 stop:408 length:228 start_codon:yes stop_codon:yes gene_type:complete